MAPPLSSGAAPVEITPLPEPTVFAPGQEPLSMVVGMARQEPEDSVPPAAASQQPLAQIPTTAPEPELEEDSGEPRRRRRRSSAAV